MRNIYRKNYEKEDKYSQNAQSGRFLRRFCMVKEAISVYSENMNIQSPAFKHGERIPPKYTCDGENVIPPLVFSDIPPDTKSLVLLVDDPDSSARVWDHWILYNIPPDVRETRENEVPEGAMEGTNSFGEVRYGGPCPQEGEHRYFFKVYALDAILDMPKGVSKAEIERQMEGHIIEKAEIFARYRRA